MGAKTDTKRDALLRASLAKILPGYKWTVHKGISAEADLRVTGIQSRGSNRCSTVEIRQRSDGGWFESRISGYGRYAPWLASGCGSTVAQAVRSLQTALTHKAGIYRSQAATLQAARGGKEAGS